MINNGTQLNGRIAWFDGTSSFELDALYDYLLSGKPIDSDVFITDFSKEIRQFNSLNPNTPLEKKTEVAPYDLSWNIPDYYKTIDISKFILTKLLEELNTSNDFTQGDIDERISRVQHELELYKEYNMTDILKVVAYIVDEFKKNNVVWGTGRGSSCCSYCLYLIGLHDVDSIKYDLSLTEFFR